MHRLSEASVVRSRHRDYLGSNNGDDDDQEFDQVIESRWGANKIRYHYSPRGYCAASPRCRAITDYYVRFHNEEEKREGWAFKREGIALAKEFISARVYDWLKAQELSPYCYGRNRDFLVDTINFINTGKRKMSVQSWRGLLVDGQKECPSCVKKEKPLPRLNARTHSELIAKWCSFPKGFEDMICTLNLLFGEPYYERALGEQLRQ